MERGDPGAVGAVGAGAARQGRLEDPGQPGPHRAVQHRVPVPVRRLHPHPPRQRHRRLLLPVQQGLQGDGHPTPVSLACQARVGVGRRGHPPPEERGPARTRYSFSRSSSSVYSIRPAMVRVPVPVLGSSPTLWALTSETNSSASGGWAGEASTARLGGRGAGMHGVRGCLGRRPGPGTRLPPRSPPPRAPLAPLVAPSGTHSAHQTLPGERPLGLRDGARQGARAPGRGPGAARGRAAGLAAVRSSPPAPPHAPTPRPPRSPSDGHAGCPPPTASRRARRRRRVPATPRARRRAGRSPPRRRRSSTSSPPLPPPPPPLGQGGGGEGQQPLGHEVVQAPAQA